MIKDIEEKAKQNTFFRHVLENGEHSQVVLMSIAPQGEIGEETHPDNDQILYLVEGDGKAVINGEEQPFEEDDLILVKAGTKHNFINTGNEDLKIITIYAPAHHPAGTIYKTKTEADQATY
ncbi:cupin domain-containing protein [Candidatus Daviesbacteria bacterium]|nr:cupin domain-containing protein [Candidatus Daviesbacteria bacterium]